MDAPERNVQYVRVPCGVLLDWPNILSEAPLSPSPLIVGEQEAGVRLIEKREDDGPAPRGGVVAH